MKNKISVYVIIVIVVSLFIRCSSTPNCNGNLEIETLKSIFKDELLKNKDRYQKTFLYMGEEIDFTRIEKRFDDFLENTVEIDLARPTDINEKLHSCQCQATLKLKISDDWWKALLKNLEAPTEYDIVYSIQEVKDKTIVETDLILVTKIVNIFLSGFMMEEMGEDPTLEH